VKINVIRATYITFYLVDEEEENKIGGEKNEEESSNGARGSPSV
jgi:hypothetical protein